LEIIHQKQEIWLRLCCAKFLVWLKKCIHLDDFGWGFAGSREGGIVAGVVGGFYKKKKGFFRDKLIACLLLIPILCRKRNVQGLEFCRFG
jgi:hypothetical protein